MLTDRTARGRSVATRRAVADVVRAAVLGSYGVTGVSHDRPIDRLLVALRLRRRGIRIRLDRGLEVDLDLEVAFGLPVAEVARQVDSAVRYAVRRSFGHEVRRLTIHVDGLRYQPASVPPTRDLTQPPEATGLLDGASAEDRPAVTLPAVRERG